MAEFCLDCISKTFNEKPKKRKYVLSSEPDLCEGCGECKRVVIRYRHPKWVMFKKRFLTRFKKKK